MQRVKVQKNKEYTVISNVFLKDTNLSLKAKGLLALIMSLPDNWDFSGQGIVSIVKESETAVYSAIDELITNKYCKRVRISEKGKFAGYEYTFFEKPFLENPETEKPKTEIPNPENQEQISKEEPSKEEIIKKEKNSILTFENFWDMYDYKVGIAKAQTAFEKLSKTDLEAIKKHLPVYVKNTEPSNAKIKKGLTFRKHPSSYLNQKTFLDEITEVTPHFETQSKKIIPKQPIVNAGNMYFNEDGSMK